MPNPLSQLDSYRRITEVTDDNYYVATTVLSHLAYFYDAHGEEWRAEYRRVANLVHAYEAGWKPLTHAFVDRIKELVDGVEVDLDAPLRPEDEDTEFCYMKREAPSGLGVGVISYVGDRKPNVKPYLAGNDDE